MKKIIFTILILCAVFAAVAEEAEQKVYEKFNEALGFQYGEIVGTGISYYHSLGRVSIQTAAGVMYLPFSEDESNWYGNTLDYNMGVEMQFEVIGNDLFSWISSQLYGFVGICHRGFIPIHEDSIGTDPNIEIIVTKGDYTPVVTLGAGIGIEAIFFNHLSIPIELGYAVSWSPTLADDISKQIKVELKPQVGFRYRY